MIYVDLIVFTVFIVLIVVGYKRNNRNILVAASMLIVVVFCGPEFVRGFHDGFVATAIK